jgi:hypothetical protein
MAPEIKWDLEDQTSLVKGVETFAPTRGLRKFTVTGLLGLGRTGLNEALDTASEDAPYHPDVGMGDDPTEMEGLPLQAVQGQHFDTDRVMGVGVYAHTQFSVPRWPAFDFANVETFISGRRTINRFPTESFISSDYGAIPWYRTISFQRVDLLRSTIHVRTILDKNPLPTIEHNTGLNYSELIMTINSDPIKINGRNYPKGTLRFNGLNVTPFDAGDSVKYVVNYIFLEDPRTHYTRWLVQARILCSTLTPELTEGTCHTGAVGQRIVMWTEFLVDKPITWPPEGVGLVGTRFHITPQWTEISYRRTFPTHDGGEDEGMVGGLPVFL